MHPDRLARNALPLPPQVGDPFHPDSDQGPQVSREQLDRILKYIDLGKQEGATLATGGARCGDKGYYVQPTVFQVCACGRVSDPSSASWWMAQARPGSRTRHG